MSNQWQDEHSVRKTDAIGPSGFDLNVAPDGRGEKESCENRARHKIIFSTQYILSTRTGRFCCCNNQFSTDRAPYFNLRDWKQLAMGPLRSVRTGMVPVRYHWVSVLYLRTGTLLPPPVPGIRTVVRYPYYRAV